MAGGTALAANGIAGAGPCKSSALIRGQVKIIRQSISCHPLLGLLGAVLLLLAGCVDQVTPRGRQVAEAWHLGRQFDHVLIVVFENKDYSQVIQDPYIRQLAAQGTLFTDFHGLFHPSYPNYLAMVSGRDIPTSRDYPTNINAPTIADLLTARGLTWRQYAEDYPGHCFTGGQSGLYVRKHTPFISFLSIQRNPAACANVVSAAAFDAAHLPNYAFYTPNLCDDAHDCSWQRASAWLQRFIAPFLQNPRLLERTLLVITFDESGGHIDRHQNHILTLFLGGPVRQGMVETHHYDHFNVLRTIEENFALGTLGEQDQQSMPITEVWKTSVAARPTSAP
jgi:hypothetical protein